MPTPWEIISHSSNYKYAIPTTEPMSAAPHIWETLEKKVSSGSADVYEQLLPGDPIRQDRNHVIISGGIVPDAEIPGLKEKADFLDATGLADTGVSKMDGRLVGALNKYLEDCDFGPYNYVSEAVNQLLNLRKKGRGGNTKAAKKADTLEAKLKAFAKSKGSSLTAFLQWPALMLLKQDRDSFAHPFDEGFLLGELKLRNPDLVPVEEALKLLLNKKPE